MKNNKGFSLIELLVVMIMIGILSAIAAPSWLGFLNNQKLTAAQNLMITSLQSAQINAKSQRVEWQVSFKSDTAQYALHKSSEPPLAWTNLGDNISLESTFKPVGTNTYAMAFNRNGTVSGGQLGNVTISLKSGGSRKKCAIVQTLLGAIKTAEDLGCN